VWVSALTVAEAANTPTPEFRLALMGLLKRLTGRNRPLEVPTMLIRRGIQAWAEGAPSFSWSVGEENEGIWVALQVPSLVDEDDRRLNLDQLQKGEVEFRDGHVKARPAFQALFESEGWKRPRSAAAMLREYAKNRRFQQTVINPLVHPILGNDLSEEQVTGLLEALPEFAGYMLGWGHSVHSRAIASHGFGARNAGLTDLSFAAYLPKVDFFVTADIKQYRALRLIARFTHRCRVLTYRMFRRRLLLEPAPSNEGGEGFHSDPNHRKARLRPWDCAATMSPTTSHSLDTASCAFPVRESRR